jgi:hypothetical protein
VAVLFVEFCELIEVVVAYAIAAFYRVQLLATCTEVKALWTVISLWGAFLS